MWHKPLPRPNQGMSVGWIRYPNGEGLQAVHKRQGREVSRPFSFAEHGYERAHVVARRWLRLCQCLDPANSRLASAPQRNKTQPYPRGVSLSVKERRSGTRQYSMSVYWHDGHKPRNKTFYAGSEDVLTNAELRVAERAAIAFRQAYVRWRAEGGDFDPADWVNWQRTYA